MTTTQNPAPALSTVAQRVANSVFKLGLVPLIVDSDDDTTMHLVVLLSDEAQDEKDAEWWLLADYNGKGVVLCGPETDASPFGDYARGEVAIITYLQQLYGK